MPAKNTALSNYDKENYELPVDEALELARSHHLVGNFVLAERTYHDILRAVPDNATAHHLLGALYYQVGNIEKALHHMKTSIDLRPEEKQYWSNYGSVLNMAKRYDEAIDCFDKVLGLDPDNVETLNRKSLTLWQKGLHKEAESAARRSLEISPHNLDGLIDLGLSLAGQACLHDAAKTWKEASDHHPDDVRVWSNWANTLLEMHQPGKAAILARRAIELDPDHADAHNNLGCALREMGHAVDAIESFRTATNITPKYYQAHYNMALALADLARHEEASIAARYAIDFNENYADAYNILSSSLLEMGEFSRSHFAAQRAVQLKPDDAESYMNLADVLYLSARFDDGHAALKEALKRDPDNPRSYAKLANIYERLDEVDEALDAIDKAIELAPEVPMFLVRKAAMLHIASEVEESLEVVDRAIEMAPSMMLAYVTKAEALVAVNRMAEARETILKAKDIQKDSPLVCFTLANLGTFTSEEDEDFQTMLSLEDTVKAMGLHYSASLYYAIAKVYDSLKNYDKAFEYYEKANREKRRLIPYDGKSVPPTFEVIKKDYSPEILKELEGQGFESDLPVFIVGMPRSGTTLTEQILSAHPEVYGAGELPDVTRAQRKTGKLVPENAREMGQLYVEMLTARDKTGKARRVTDKMPGNYMNIGLIASILPRAKIIHCARNPFDTCLSNYKQNFMTGQFWSYDLEELGEEYVRYLDLMDYWHEVLPGRILDVSYEETVSNLEEQARRMIDFIGLEWDDACLAPHKQERAVLTASKMQVTQPVYKSSVEKWRRYEKQLQPLVRIIRPEEALPVE